MRACVLVLLFAGCATANATHGIDAKHSRRPTDFHRQFEDAFERAKADWVEQGWCRVREVTQCERGSIVTVSDLYEGNSWYFDANGSATGNEHFGCLGWKSQGKIFECRRGRVEFEDLCERALSELTRVNSRLAIGNAEVEFPVGVTSIAQRGLVGTIDVPADPTLPVTLTLESNARVLALEDPVEWQSKDRMMRQEVVTIERGTPIQLPVKMFDGSLGRIDRAGALSLHGGEMRAAAIALVFGACAGAPIVTPTESEFDRARAQLYEAVTTSYLDEGVCFGVSIDRCGSSVSIKKSSMFYGQRTWFGEGGAKVGSATWSCTGSETEGLIPSCEGATTTEDVCAIVRQRLRRVAVMLSLAEDSHSETRRFEHDAMDLTTEGVSFLVRFDANPETPIVLEVSEIDAATMTSGELLDDESFGLSRGDRVLLPLQLKRNGAVALRIQERSHFALKDPK